jgi:DNA-binding transcriptional ArsR family regulator
MKQPESLPIDALERVFHEPNRLAILSTLCAADDAISFTELRDTCGLTDGNLNRHLKALEDDGIISVKKSFIDRKPRTTITITHRGLNRFQTYIDALRSALKHAQQSIPQTKSDRLGLRTSRA